MKQPTRFLLREIITDGFIDHAELAACKAKILPHATAFEIQTLITAIVNQLAIDKRIKIAKLRQPTTEKAL